MCSTSPPTFEIPTSRLADPPQPEIRKGKLRQVIIRHPAWPEGVDSFLMLNTVDDLDGTLIHLRTVWLAAAIIAGNAFDGYLSTSRYPTDTAISLDQHTELIHGSYWFHVPRPQHPLTPTESLVYNYPICTGFSDWWFPHETFPSWWPRDREPSALNTTTSIASIPQYVYCTDQSCRVTGHTSDQYSRHGINDLGNLILLRADIYRVFDQGHIVFFPKGETNPLDFVVQFLSHSGDLLPLYSNRKLFPIGRLSKECLFIRFAWAIFNFLLPKPSGFQMRKWRGKTTVEEPKSSGAAEDTISPKVQSKRKGSSTSQPTRVLPKRTCRQRPTENLCPSTPPIRSETQLSSEEKEEEKEDKDLIQKIAPGLRNVNDPSELEPSLRPLYSSLEVYPGHRKVERLKEDALKQQRPATYDSSKDLTYLEKMAMNGNQDPGDAGSVSRFMSPSTDLTLSSA